MILQRVIKEFNGKGEVIPLQGGRGNSFLVGDIVIKKNDGDIQNYELIALILNDINSIHYRISKPIKTRSGKYVYEGYVATKYELGYHDMNRLSETIKISDLFHKDISRFHPSLLKKTDTIWAQSMDILFRNREIPEGVNKQLLDKCLPLLRELPRIEDPLQIIHADIGGNILFHDELTPCIIDFSPNIAPSKMANAIIICDAIAWNGKDFRIMDLLNYNVYKNYYLYAVVFRILTMLCKEDVTVIEFNNEYKAYIKIWNYIMQNI